MVAMCYQWSKKKKNWPWTFLPTTEEWAATEQKYGSWYDVLDTGTLQPKVIHIHIAKALICSCTIPKDLNFPTICHQSVSQGY